MTKKAIRTFLNNFATKVNETPDSQIDVWIDDHICVKWGGIEYYVPENNSFYTSEDDAIYEHLLDKFQI